MVLFYYYANSQNTNPDEKPLYSMDIFMGEHTLFEQADETLMPMCRQWLSKNTR